MRKTFSALAGLLIALASPVWAQDHSAVEPEETAPVLANHPYHEALREAFAQETDAGRRATLAANLRRWERMPAALGERYLLVNAAAFELTLWEGRREMGRWRVIVGTPRTPTPIFQAEVSGVIFNPWWEIPASIAAEGIAAMVRNRPAAARQRGYVYQNGRYRQRPGPGNALGLMKLVMPNPYSVFLHDTSNRTLFERDVRALSHGCIRVGDALGFATELLAARPDWNRARTDEVVESGRTTQIDLPESIPLYIGYFTAEPGSDGEMRYFEDIYGRDRSVSATRLIDRYPAEGEQECRS
ncbi:MAG: L,D-transpeptidase family protein [Parasphingopyxis sp.]|uniref:L,D-transpeptidase family protein n=1 Tax=Parasphingopyxis sp. TaxID=1920299 RepID=UPI003FA141B1